MANGTTTQTRCRRCGKVKAKLGCGTKPCRCPKPVPKVVLSPSDPKPGEVDEMPLLCIYCGGRHPAMNGVCGYCSGKWRAVAARVNCSTDPARDSGVRTAIVHYDH